MSFHVHYECMFLREHHECFYGYIIRVLSFYECIVKTLCFYENIASVLYFYEYTLRMHYVPKRKSRAY